MKTRKLGNTNLEFTTIGFGAWAIGGGDWQYSWGAQDDKESIASIHKALDIGINWIDTAAVYGLGHSEEIVGKAVKGLSKKPIIATKCSLCWGTDRKIYNSLKKESIRKEVDASLKRLQLDVIDLYQIHWPNPEPEIEEGWTTLAELVKEGKVRYIGVSNFSVVQMQKIQPIHPIASLQPPYSMLRRGVEENILEYCGENNIGVIVYSPMQKGLLTGKITKERIKKFPPDDHRKKDPMFQEPSFSMIQELLKHLQPIAERNHKTLAQLSLAWVLRRSEVTAAIVGTRNPAQIEETAQASDWTLSSKDIQEIETLLQKYKITVTPN